MNMKKLSLMTILFTIASSNLFAETVKCNGNLNDSYKTPVELIIEKDETPYSPSQSSYKIAKTTFTYAGKQQKTNYVRRFEHSGKTVYKDILDRSSFRLEIINFIGELQLDTKTTFKKVIKNLECSITGKISGQIGQCPIDEAGNGIANEKLLFAAKDGNFRLIEDLLTECQANVNYINSLGCNPLLTVMDRDCGKKEKQSYQQSSSYENEIIKTLIDFGANLEVKDPIDGKTALAKSIEYRSFWTTSTLVNAKADVNSKDINGNTPLILAVLNNSKAQVAAVLEGRPDTLMTNNEGKTALQLAEEYKFVDIIELLTPEFEVIKVTIDSNGKCSPSMIHLVQGETVEIELQATNKMLHLDVPELDISMMAMPNESERLPFTPDKKGTFSYTCKEHGGSKSSGSIMVM